MQLSMKRVTAISTSVRIHVFKEIFRHIHPVIILILKFEKQNLLENLVTCPKCFDVTANNENMDQSVLLFFIKASMP